MSTPSLLLFYPIMFVLSSLFLFFFFNDTATTEIYTLSLHDALPICCLSDSGRSPSPQSWPRCTGKAIMPARKAAHRERRSDDPSRVLRDACEPTPPEKGGGGHRVARRAAHGSDVPGQGPSVPLRHSGPCPAGGRLSRLDPGRFPGQARVRFRRIRRFFLHITGRGGGAALSGKDDASPVVRRPPHHGGRHLHEPQTGIGRRARQGEQA